MLLGWESERGGVAAAELVIRLVPPRPRPPHRTRNKSNYLSKRSSFTMAGEVIQFVRASPPVLLSSLLSPIPALGLLTFPKFILLPLILFFWLLYFELFGSH